MSKRALWILALVAAPASARADDCHSNFMLVLDRSCSMNKKLTGSANSKWQDATTAINALTSAYDDQIDFGLIMFPDAASTPNTCAQDGPIYVPVGASTGSTIGTTLTGNPPGDVCTTPLQAGVLQVTSDPHFAMPYSSGNRSYAMLITDGKQGCGESDDDVVAAVKALYDAGYPTYVVGFGSQADPVMLTAAAIAGGVPRAGSGDGGVSGPDGGVPSYYQADDEAALQEALQNIVGNVVGEFSTCTGTPCPDGRCFQPGQTCMNGFCADPPPDFAGMNDSAVPLDGEEDGGSMTAPGNAMSDAGCACSLGGGGPDRLAIAIVLFALALVLRRRVAR